MKTSSRTLCIRLGAAAALISAIWWGVPPVSGQEVNGLRFEIVRIGFARYLRVSAVDPHHDYVFPSPPWAHIERGEGRWSLQGKDISKMSFKRAMIGWGHVSVVRPGTPLLFHIKAPSGTLALQVRDGDYAEEIRRDGLRNFWVYPWAGEVRLRVW